MKCVLLKDGLRGRGSVNASELLSETCLGRLGREAASVLLLGDCLTISPWRKNETKSERDGIVRNSLPTQHLEKANNSDEEKDARRNQRKYGFEVCLDICQCLSLSFILL